jgi:Helix-turn-helix domain
MTQADTASLRTDVPDREAKMGPRQNAPHWAVRRLMSRPRIASLKELPDGVGPDGRSLTTWGNLAAVNHVMLSSEAKTGRDLLVLMAVARQTASDGPERGTGSPSVQVLEALTRLPTRTVQRALRDLADASELEVAFTAAEDATNVYRIPSLVRGGDGQFVGPGVNLQAMHCVMLFSEGSGRDLLVQMAIARFAKASGKHQGSSYPSVETLAALTRFSTRTVQRAIQSLEVAGEVRVDFESGPSGTNRYTISMLEHGGVRSTDKLPLYVLGITREVEKDSLDGKGKKGSSHVNVTPGEVARRIRAVSVRLADWLIASGRKHPAYRTDAESLEWRDGASELISELDGREPGWRKEPKQFLDALFEHVATTERWQYIRTPRDVYYDVHDILNDMPEQEDAKPTWDSVTPQCPTHPPVDPAAFRRELGLPPVQTVNGWTFIGNES